MDCSGDEKGGVERPRCKLCGHVEPGVRFEYALKRWLCHWCWVKTPIPR